MVCISYSYFGMYNLLILGIYNFFIFSVPKFINFWPYADAEGQHNTSSEIFQCRNTFLWYTSLHAVISKTPTLI